MILTNTTLIFDRGWLGGCANNEKCYWIGNCFFCFLKWKFRQGSTTKMISVFLEENSCFEKSGMPFSAFLERHFEDLGFQLASLKHTIFKVSLQFIFWKKYSVFTSWTKIHLSDTNFYKFHSNLSKQMACISANLITLWWPLFLITQSWHPGLFFSWKV